MKYLVLIAMLYGANVFAQLSESENEADAMAPIEMSKGADNAFGVVSCEAHTVCRSGRRIWCTSRGGSCTSHENPGRDVVCVGYDLPNYRGAWHKSWDTCP